MPIRRSYGKMTEAARWRLQLSNVADRRPGTAACHRRSSIDSGKPAARLTLQSLDLRERQYFVADQIGEPAASHPDLSLGTSYFDPRMREFLDSASFSVVGYAFCFRRSLIASATVSAKCLRRTVCVSCSAANASSGVRAMARSAQP